MSIEIVIGLPHLNDGPILARARRLQQPMLISANALPQWSSRREWTGWRLSQFANAHGLAPIDFDSADFVAMALYRGLPWSVDDYFRRASAFPFGRIAICASVRQSKLLAFRPQYHRCFVRRAAPA